MTPATSFHGYIDDQGRVVWRDKAGIQQFVSGMKGCRVLITIEESNPKNSLNQMRYLHGVVFKAMAESSGWEMEEIKTLMKCLYLGHFDRRGRFHSRGVHTLNRREMSIFIEDCVRHAAQWFDCCIPAPETCPESYAA